MRGCPNRSVRLWGQHFCVCCINQYMLYYNKNGFNVGTLLSWRTFSVSSNIIQWCIHGSLLVYHCWQCETSPVNGPRMCSCNAEAPLCVGDAILFVSTYILVVFLDISWFECFRCSICCRLGLALLYGRICACLCSFLVIRVIDFVAPSPALIDQSSVTFDFQLNLFFQVTLFYSSLYTFFVVIKLPSVNYLLSDLSYVAFFDTWRYCKLGFSK